MDLPNNRLSLPCPLQRTWNDWGYLCKPPLSKVIASQTRNAFCWLVSYAIFMESGGQLKQTQQRYMNYIKFGSKLQWLSALLLPLQYILFFKSFFFHWKNKKLSFQFSFLLSSRVKNRVLQMEKLFCLVAELWWIGRGVWERSTLSVWICKLPFLGQVAWENRMYDMDIFTSLVEHLTLSQGDEGTIRVLESCVRTSWGWGKI